MDLKIILLLVIITAYARAATQCFSCNSGTDSGCNDPFSSNAKVACDSKQCFKATGKASGHQVTYRGCGNILGTGNCLTGNFDFNGVAVEYLCCDGNNCNSADLVSFQPKLIFVLIAMFYMFFI